MATQFKKSPKPSHLQYFGIILTKFGVNCVILLGRIGNNAQPELKKYPHLHKRNPQTEIADYLLVVANVPARREQ